MKVIPRLYPILDGGALRSRGVALEAFARVLHAAGIRFLQYRDKDVTDDKVLQRARWLRGLFPAGEATLILNDRVHLCAAAGFDGVHVGQGDMSPEEARGALGPDGLLGYSTHNTEQVRAGERSAADYLAIGPVFGTASKENPGPVVGLAGVREARGLTTKPLVAIGGITRANGRAVLEAGADAAAVISGLLPLQGGAPADDLIREREVRDFLHIFR